MESYSHVAIRRKGEITMDLLKMFCLRHSVKSVACSPALPSPTSPTSPAQKSDVCAGCEKTISTGTVILAMEKTWHMSCFRCVQRERVHLVVDCGVVWCVQEVICFVFCKQVFFFLDHLRALLILPRNCLCYFMWLG